MDDESERLHSDSEETMTSDDSILEGIGAGLSESEQDSASTSGSIFRNYEVDDDEWVPGRHIEGKSWDDPNLVTHNIKRILNSQRTFQSQFCFTRDYVDAPNPVLVVPSFGIVGLPLTSKVADDLKEHFIQVQSNINMASDMSATPRNMWELPPASATFLSEAWQGFLERAIQDAYSALGSTRDEAEPSYELDTVLLLGAGAQLPQSMITSDDDHVFAKLMLSLPAQYSGGALHLVHEGVSSIHDTVDHSLFVTSAAAWYTSVTVEADRIVDGHRMILLYSLLCAPGAERPQPPPYKDALSCLNRVLEAWSGDLEKSTSCDVSAEVDKSDAGPVTPDIITFLLDSIPGKDFSDDAFADTPPEPGSTKACVPLLAGADSRRLSLLRTAAARWGFSVGFASGGVQSIFDASFTCIPGPDDAETLHILKLGDKDTELTPYSGPLRALDGRTIMEEYPWYEEIDDPDTIVEEITAGQWAEQEALGEVEVTPGVGEGYIQRVYERLFLVLWPRGSARTMRYSGESGFARACSDLEGVLRGSERNMPLARHVVSRHQQDKRRALALGMEAACAWGAEDLLHEVFAACEDDALAHVPDELKLRAIETFGFDAVRAGFEEMLRADKNTRRRLLFVSCLRAFAEGSSDIESWTTELARAVLQSMRKPGNEDIHLLLDTAVEHGGLPFLRENIIGTIINTADVYVILDFVAALSTDSRIGDFEERHSVVHDLLSAALSKLSFTAKGGAEMARRFITESSESGCIDLVDSALKTVQEHIPEEEGDAGDFAMSIMLPLLVHCSERARAVGAHLESLGSFTDVLMQSYLHRLERRATGGYEHREGHAKEILNAIILSKNPEARLARLLSELRAMPMSLSDLHELVDTLHEGREALVSQGVIAPDVLEESILNLAQRYAAQAPLATITDIVDILAWSEALGLPDAAAPALHRLSDTSTLDTAYTRTVLLAALAPLAAWAERTARRALVAPALTAIVARWHAAVGTQPTAPRQLAQLATWTCACAHCARVRAFLRDTRAAELTLEGIGAAAARHVAAEAAAHAGALAACEAVSVRARKHGCKVRKTAALAALVAWHAEIDRAGAVLASVGDDEAAQRAVLGDVYDKVAQLASQQERLNGAHYNVDSLVKVGDAGQGFGARKTEDLGGAGASRRLATNGAGSTPAAKREHSAPEEKKPGLGLSGAEGAASEQPPAKKLKMDPEACSPGQYSLRGATER